MSKDFTWLDSGTHDALQKASQFVHNFEETHNSKIACLEEIAFLNGWLEEDKLRAYAKGLPNSYGDYLLNLI